MAPFVLKVIRNLMDTRPMVVLMGRVFYMLKNYFFKKKGLFTT